MSCLPSPKLASLLVCFSANQLITTWQEAGLTIRTDGHLFVCDLRVCVCVCIRTWRWCLFCTKSAYCANHKAKLAQHQSTSNCVRACVCVHACLLSKSARALVEIHHATDACMTSEYTQTSPAVNSQQCSEFFRPAGF